MTDVPPMRWCRSRRGRALCTRPTGHAGLHNRVGTSRMWSERDADPPACGGSGTRVTPAPALPDGFPHGRGLCPVCAGFVPLRGGRIDPHDAFRGTDDLAAASDRAAWFNAHGWAD
jgi:hypothetical protein